MKKLKFMVIFSLVAGCVIAVNSIYDVGFAQKTGVQPLQSIPLSIKPCISDKSIDLILEGGADDGEKEFYFLSYHLGNENLRQFTLVSKDEIGCQVVMPANSYLPESLTLYMSEEAAQLIALQQYQREIEYWGGQEIYEKKLNAEPSEGLDDRSFFFPEQLWALQQLGIHISEPYQVIKSWDEVPPFPLN